MPVVTLTLAGAGPGAVLTLGDLKVATTDPFNYSGARSTLARTNGKWWFEVDTTHFTTLGGTALGLVNVASPNYTTLYTNALHGCIIYRSGEVYTNGSHAGFATNIQVWGSVLVAVDLDLNKVWFRSPDPVVGWNNDPLFLEDPTGNVGGFDISGITASLPGVYAVGIVSGLPNSLIFNFGASPPITTPPPTFCPWDDVSCTPVVATVHLKQGPYYRLAPPTQVFTLTSTSRTGISSGGCRLVVTEAPDVFSGGSEVVAPADAAVMDVTEDSDVFSGEVASVTLPHGLIEGEIIYIPQEDQVVRIEPEPLNVPLTIPYEDAVIVIPYNDR